MSGESYNLDGGRSTTTYSKMNAKCILLARHFLLHGVLDIKESLVAQTVSKVDDYLEKQSNEFLSFPQIMHKFRSGGLEFEKSKITGNDIVKVFSELTRKTFQKASACVLIGDGVTLAVVGEYINGGFLLIDPVKSKITSTNSPVFTMEKYITTHHQGKLKPQRSSIYFLNIQNGYKAPKKGYKFPLLEEVSPTSSPHDSDQPSVIIVPKNEPNPKDKEEDTGPEPVVQMPTVEQTPKDSQIEMPESEPQVVAMDIEHDEEEEGEEEQEEEETKPKRKPPSRRASSRRKRKKVKLDL